MAADSEHPVPTERARELVRGGVDYHVHIAPDFVSRRITDVQLARRCLETGQAGFGLKSHYSSTAERAQVVAEAVPGVTVLGAITLNRSVGGLNPLAVEIAAREGARIVWFPTVSSVNEQHEVLAADPEGKVPVWVRFELSLREAGLACEPVPVVDEQGALLPEAHEVLEVVARHQMVLCTGHLSRDEIFALVDAAVGAGIETIVVTHPEFPSQSVAPDDQVELARKGALLERCFTDDLHRQGAMGALLRGDARRRPRAHRVVVGPRPELQPARRGRARAHGRPLPRGGVQRGRRAHDGGGEHAPGRGAGRGPGDDRG